MVRQQSLEKCGLGFEEIWPCWSGPKFRKRFQRQQNRSLGIALRCGLLRQKRKRKRLAAKSLVAGIKRLFLSGPGLICAQLRLLAVL